MRVEYFITRRLALTKQKSFSRFIIGIATSAVALSVLVMIVAMSLVNGFQQEISSKVYGFWGHVIITPFGFGYRFEDGRPISADMLNMDYVKTMPEVEHVQSFAYKAGIIKANDNIEGIVLKGVGPEFDWSYFEQYLTKGHVFQAGDTVADRSILLSKVTAERLALDTGDRIELHFIDRVPRVRRMTVSGIYNTGLEEYDEKFALADVGVIQQLNDWEKDEFSGYELTVKNKDMIEAVNEDIYYNALSAELISQTIMEINPNIFDWLALQDMNKYIILILMTVVAIINITTCLLILILERTNMIGTLKALGATNWSIRKIFVYYGAYITGVGLLIGNVVGLALLLAQKQWGIITLPEESYYVSVAPVDIDLLSIAAVDLATLVVCTIVLLVPSYLISRISPVKAIRFK